MSAHVQGIGCGQSSTLSMQMKTLDKCNQYVGFIYFFSRIECAMEEEEGKMNRGRDVSCFKSCPRSWATQAPIQ